LANSVIERLRVSGDVLIQEFVSGTGIGYCFVVGGRVFLPFLRNQKDVIGKIRQAAARDLPSGEHTPRLGDGAQQSLQGIMA